MKVVKPTPPRKEECWECEEEYEMLIEFHIDGEGDDFADEDMPWICKDCLKKALELLEKKL